MVHTRVILGLVMVLSGATVLTVDARQYTPSKADSDNYRGKPCSDPWINIAYRLADNTSPPGYGTVGACDPMRYAGGRWQSYDQLKDAVMKSRATYAVNFVGERVIAATQSGRYRLQTFVNNQPAGSLLIGQDGASLIFDAASLIGKGGAGIAAIVAAGGGNIVAGGGGNIVAAGGGNMKDLGGGLYLRTIAR